MARGKKRTSALFLALGSGLLAFLIYKVGPDVVLDQLALVG